MPDELDEPQTHAAGPWQEGGEPEKHGRYLIEYEQYGQRSVFVADYRLLRDSEDLDLQWTGVLGDAEVLRYARIRSPYTEYHE